MKRETNEIAFRLKLIFGLAMLGGITGGLLYLHFFVFDRQLVELPRYGVAFYNAFTLDAPGAQLVLRELLYSFAAGAGLLVAPVLWLFFRRRSGARF